MQTNDSRPLRKGDRSVQAYPGNALKDATETVADALILNPTLPAVQLADILYQSTPADLKESLAAVLIRKFYARTIRSQRMKETRDIRTQLLLPGFESLPLTIPGLNGTAISLLDANYRRVRDYYWSLMKAASAKNRANPKIKQAKDLMERMRERSRTEKGITVREVILLDR